MASSDSVPQPAAKVAGSRLNIRVADIEGSQYVGNYKTGQLKGKNVEYFKEKIIECQSEYCAVCDVYV